jgi:Cu(I)/Ag(I) efflux system membrane protein CusA/SilA
MPEFVKPLLRWAWPDRQSTQQFTRELDASLKFAGIPNIWTMPIRNRVDMLSTGVRTPVGVKVLGADLASIEKVGEQVEGVLRQVPGTRSVFSERAAGGYFLDVVWDREKLGRYGLSMEDAQMHLAAALGGENISTVVRGRERYGLAVRYKADFRDHIEDVKRVLITPMGSGQAMGQGPVPLGLLAEVRQLEGPSMLRNEDGRLAAYVYADVADRDLGSYVAEAKAAVAAKVKLPAGTALRFSGQVEDMERSRARLAWLLPLTLLVIVGLLFMNSRSWTRVVIVLTAVPFSLIGSVWLLWALDYNLSVAVWVGFIALAGLDAETGMFMLLYLELAYDKAKEEGRMASLTDLRAAIHEGAVKRVRPKVMTVAVDFVGLLPVMIATGTGADVMKRVAAPLVGGLASSFLLELLVYPVIFWYWKGHTEGLMTSKRPWVNGFWKAVARIG